MIPEKYEKYFIYFDRSVLTSYRASSHIYRLKEDDMGGILETISSNEGCSLGDSSSHLFRIKIGFRRLEDKRVCIALFALYLKKFSDEHLRIWQGHKIDCPRFVQDDPAFERWVTRYLEGS